MVEVIERPEVGRVRASEIIHLGNNPRKLLAHFSDDITFHSLPPTFTLPRNVKQL